MTPSLENVAIEPKGAYFGLPPRALSSTSLVTPDPTMLCGARWAGSAGRHRRLPETILKPNDLVPADVGRHSLGSNDMETIRGRMRMQAAIHTRARKRDEGNRPERVR